VKQIEDGKWQLNMKGDYHIIHIATFT